MVWVDKAVATMGVNEGTPHRASQPSIIMQPDRAIPTGPKRTHNTRIANVATRRILTDGEYPQRLGRVKFSRETVVSHGTDSVAGPRTLLPELTSRHGPPCQSDD